MRDFVNFARDMKEKHGKYVIDVSDGTTSKTTAGMQILEDRALAAERERMRMAKRRSLAAKGIRLDGRWNGGLCPFGYAPVGVPGKGKRQRLVKDDVYAPVLKRMVTDTLAGKSLEFIARWLNAEGVPTATDIGRMRYGRPAKNTGWKAQSVRAVLNNRAMTGVTTYNGEIVRGKNNLPIMRAEPIVDDAQWQAVQIALARPAGRTEGERQSRMLLHVAICGMCFSHMYGRRNRYQLYYYCPNRTSARGNKAKCITPMIRTDALDSLMSETIMTTLGDVQRQETTVTPGNDKSLELARLDEAIKALPAQVTSGALTASAYAALAGDLSRMRDSVAAEATPETRKTIDLDETFGQHWQSLDTAGRRAFLMRNRVRVTVLPDSEVAFGAWSADFNLSEEGKLARIVQITNHRVFVWLGDLEHLSTDASTGA